MFSLFHCTLIMPSYPQCSDVCHEAAWYVPVMVPFRNIQFTAVIQYTPSA